jgi:hypothetical protein
VTLEEYAKGHYALRVMCEILMTLCMKVIVFWFLTLCTLFDVFYNRVLRRIFEPKENGMTEERRKLRNEKLNDLYSSSIIFG